MIDATGLSRAAIRAAFGTVDRFPRCGPITLSASVQVWIPTDTDALETCQLSLIWTNGDDTTAMALPILEYPDGGRSVIIRDAIDVAQQLGIACVLDIEGCRTVLLYEPDCDAFAIPCKSNHRN